MWNHTQSIFYSLSSFSQKNDDVVKCIRAFQFEKARILNKKLDNKKFGLLIYLNENKGLYNVNTSPQLIYQDSINEESSLTDKRRRIYTPSDSMANDFLEMTESVSNISNSKKAS